MSPIAEAACLEATRKTLAEYIGDLSSEIDAEWDQTNPNREWVAALQNELGKHPRLVPTRGVHREVDHSSGGTGFGGVDVLI
jgi:hypothetical protein